MKTIFLTFSVLILILFFNRAYFFNKKKKVVFYDYFIKFIFFSIILFFVTYHFKNVINLSKDYISSLIVCYFLAFFSLFFTISLKSYESPTNFIYKFLSKEYEYKKLLFFLKKKKIVSSRFDDLKNQKLIIEKKNKISLTSLGYNFTKLYYFFMKLFKIKNEG